MRAVAAAMETAPPGAAVVVVAVVPVMAAGGPRQATALQHLGTLTVDPAVVAVAVAVTTVPGRELTSTQKWAL